MKILYLCTFYHRAMIFRDSMNYLEKLGHGINVFNAVAFGAKIDEKYRSIMDDKVIHKACFRQRDRYFYFHKQQKIEEALTEAYKVEEYDGIHDHTLFNGGWVARKIKKKTGVPYVVSVRNTDLNVFLSIPLFRNIAVKIVNDASAVQFLSESYKDAFIKKCYANNPELILKKSFVIPNGLESFWLENIADPKKLQNPKELRLLCVGKIDANKNAKTVLDAIRILEKRGISAKLTIIGQVVDAKVQKELSEYKNTEILPYMTKEQLIDYYRKSDIYVMPSIRESFGRVYAEAMTQGLPVVFTRGQGFDGQFTDGEVGYPVKPMDCIEIADAIEKISNRYEEISRNCVEKCRLFDWTAIAKRLEDMYQFAFGK